MSGVSNGGTEPHLADPDVTLYQGDALEVLRGFPDEHVDCCVTSPPYWGLRDYGYESQIGLESTPERYVERLVRVFAEVRRVLTPQGTAWLNLGDTYAGNNGTGDKQRNSPSYQARVQSPGMHGSFNYTATNDEQQTSGPRKNPEGYRPKNLIGIPWRVAFALQADGWYLRSDIIWHKPNPMPESATDRPTRAHEYVFLLTRSPRYYFDATSVREPAKWERWGDQTVTKHAGTATASGWLENGSKLELQARAVEGRNCRSVWTIPTASYTGAHFATFPEDLVRRCILAGCPPGGFVLDPFVGSGTVCYVARKLARRSIGIDCNESYLDLAAERVQQQSLLVNVAGQIATSEPGNGGTSGTGTKGE